MHIINVTLLDDKTSDEDEFLRSNVQLHPVMQGRSTYRH